MPLPLAEVKLSDLLEKGGAYAGLAAFFGLAVLTVLYFAQARELKRLRDWAGRAPERAQEIEARVVAQADELRREPAAPAPRRDGGGRAPERAREIEPRVVAQAAELRREPAAPAPARSGTVGPA